MNFLVDANLSPKIATWLGQAGHTATHVRDHGMLAASDQEILDFAIDHGLVIVSADTDFTVMLAVAGLKSPSLVLLRSADHRTPQEQGGLLVANLPAVQEDLLAGAVVSIGNGRIRVRRLPM
ncbi:DUF5615 family PIN-like protein [Crossiella sp. CA-258035]|uniref:DUF5615 family PIN-like protein n=1 Tax=Crossiella sp. CA-258035 TaxID=2981138 RepID=UPI0024BC700B|nr:DUF5615 family PIN-like protein [Crossiella sp. CA-258035]WHT17055.1 DUF5615 family PIN-like protein [Crossiella sp. CA-258035]